MTIDQLRHFVTAASTKSFSHASVLEFTTQSTISKNIAYIEKELGVKLFTRYNRRVEITEAGKMFLVDAKAILYQYDTATERIRRVHPPSNAPLHIISLPLTAQYNLDSVIQKFMDEQPGVQIELDIMPERELMENLHSGIGNAYLLYEISAVLNNFAYTSLIQDELALFISADHHLAQNQSVSLNQIRYEEFVLLPDDSGIYKLCMRSFKEAEFMPSVKTTPRIEYILSQVATGRFATLLPSNNTYCYKLNNIKVVTISPKISCNVISVLAQVTERKPDRELYKKLVAYIQNTCN